MNYNLGFNKRPPLICVHGLLWRQSITFRETDQKYMRVLWICLKPSWAYGVVVSRFDFHRSDWGSNPGRGGKIS